MHFFDPGSWKYVPAICYGVTCVASYSCLYRSFSWAVGGRQGTRPVAHSSTRCSVLRYETKLSQHSSSLPSTPWPMAQGTESYEPQGECLVAPPRPMAQGTESVAHCSRSSSSRRASISLSIHAALQSGKCMPHISALISAASPLDAAQQP
jgi:hypothetical protein